MAKALLQFQSIETGLDPRSFKIEEGLSTVFSLMVVARSPRSLDLEALVGQRVSFSLVDVEPSPDGAPLTWSGICRHIEQVQAEPTGLSTYELHIVPLLWLLSQRRGYRIHQHLSIPSIVQALLGDWSFEAGSQLAQSYPQLEYKVQYGESDLTFFSRLLEEAGVTFSFGASDAGSALKLDDTPHATTPRSRPLIWTDNPNPAPGKEHATHLRISHEVRPGSSSIRDYDFRRPAFELTARAPSMAGVEAKLEQYHYRPGHFLVEGVAAAGTPVADDQGVARNDGEYGALRAAASLGAARVGRVAVSFRTNALDVGPGLVVTIQDHPHQDLEDGHPFLVTGRTLSGELASDWSFLSEVRTTTATIPYFPPQITQRPVAEGVQSALVVGGAAQEIHTDEFGRVRVQFPWDRDGASNERSSCWIRVSQGWGGTGFGLLNLPRVGQEVLVGFLEGNPDQPVIVGRVFNATNVVPYQLPQHQTRSTWKSNSSPGGNGSNEITFEDQAGKELVWVQAEKDLRKLVNHDETITVVADRQKLVKGNETETVNGTRTEVTAGPRVEISKQDKTIIIGQDRNELVEGTSNEAIGGDRLESVGGDEDLTVGGSRRELVGGDRSLTVGGDRKEAVNGTYGLTAGSQVIACGSQSVGAAGTMYLKAGSTIVVEAPDITIKAPGGFIRIDGSGVTIMGSLVKINSGGSPGVGSAAAVPAPDAPKHAGVEMPVEPTPDDVSKTRLGPGH